MASSMANFLGSDSWVMELEELCKEDPRVLPPPIYEVTSDRRGGNSAWSAVVTVCLNTETYSYRSRNWYSGQYAQGANGDAAEVAVQQIWGHAYHSAIRARWARKSGQ